MSERVRVIMDVMMKVGLDGESVYPDSLPNPAFGDPTGSRSCCGS